MTLAVTLESERLILRQFTLQDLDRLAEILADPDVMRFLPGGLPRNREQTRKTLETFIHHWQENSFGCWAVLLKETGRLTGWCGLERVKETGEVEILYMLEKDAWGKGIAPEAARVTLRYGFEVMNLRRIVAFAVPENSGSRRVMEKIGMHYEGISTLYYNAELAVYAVENEKAS